MNRWIYSIKKTESLSQKKKKKKKWKTESHISKSYQYQ